MSKIIPKGLPKEAFDIWEKVYQANKDKKDASSIAMSAVKKGWKKEDDKLFIMLDKLFSIRIIRELISYDRDGNFDHISSLKLLVLWLSQERDVVFKEEDVKDTSYDDLNKYFKQVVQPPRKNPWFL